MNVFWETPSTLAADFRDRSRRTGCLTSLLAALLLSVGLTAVPVASGQGITGSITGTVTDPTGAPIAGATVSIREVETNAVRIATTSDAGTYTVTQLAPGRYSVKVDKASFKSFEQKDLTLQIDQVQQIDAQLQIGSRNETVEVTTTAPVIQTEDSSIGLVVDSQAIQNTPLNGRLSVIGLIALAPGVQAAGAQDQLATRGVTPAVGTGSRNAYGGVGSTLDGVTNQEVTLQRGEGEVPSLDAIGEFKVLSNGAPAEFNQPAQIIVVSASGTNKLHGGAFEFNRSKGTSAKSFFSGAQPRPPYQRNEYGGNLAGPVYIPHLYDGRDKSFFFFAFEGFHLTQSYADNTQQPTVLERQGDFSELLAGGACNSTATSIFIKNPSTGLNYANNMISPTSPLSSVDQALLTALYPMPTQAGCGVNTFEEVQKISHSTRYSVRLDHKINEHNQVRFTYLRAFYGPSPTNGTDSLQGGNAQDGEHNSNFILGYTHTFSPTLLWDTYASFFHLPIYRTPQNYQTNFSGIIPGLGPELIEGAPQISITNITGVSESGSKDLEQVAQVNTAVTKVFARHTVKAGFSYLYDNHWNDSAESPQRGSYTFNGHYTGVALADFILGDPSATGLSTPNNYITRNISAQYGLFIQDDWKLRPNLTINAGLRYDLQWFRPNPYGNNSLYVPSQGKVVVFASAYPADAIPNFLTSIPIELASQANLGTNVWSYLGQDKNNVAPRLGFAYEPWHNWVARGAFGIYYNLIPASYAGGAFGTLPFVSSETYTNSTGTMPTFTMANPFSATGAFTANPSVGAQAHTVTPYTEEYNLAVEHQFHSGLDVRIGYVGQHNLKQNNSSGSGNTAPNINLANPPVVGVSAQSTNLVQPFAAISLNLDPIFHSNENSLQIGVHKQYSHGFTFGAEYQWTRVLGTENIENPSGATPNDSFGNIAGLTPQVLEVNYSYALPIGRGKWLLGNAGNLTDKILGGWQISGITDVQTGQPFSVSYSAPGSPAGQVSGRANRVPGVALYPAVKTRAQWFNPAAFTAPPCFTTTGLSGTCSTLYGNTGGATLYDSYGNSGYNMLRGPAFQDWDMNLEKNVIWKERYKLTLRADSFNIFNHPNFSTPNASISNTATVGTITSISGTPGYEQRTVEFAAKFSF